MGSFSGENLRACPFNFASTFLLFMIYVAGVLGDNRESILLSIFLSHSLL